MVEPVIIGDCHLYLGDCLEILPTLAAGSVDAVVTDPPYGLSGHNMRNAVKFMDIEWDKNPIDKSYIDLILKFGKSKIIWGGNYFDLPPHRCFLIWDKGGRMYGRTWSECEMAWTNLDSVARLFKKDNGKENKLHPTQKPLSVIKWCIEVLGDQAYTILDPFMGSGTTGVACVQTGRKFIGIEIDPHYFDIACKRIKQASLQMRMDI